MLEFQRKELQFKLDDKIHSLKYPSVKQVNEYTKKQEKAEDQLECVIDFLSGLGLDRNIAEGLEVNHLTAIIKALTEEKK